MISSTMWFGTVTTSPKRSREIGPMSRCRMGRGVWTGRNCGRGQSLICERTDYGAGRSRNYRQPAGNKCPSPIRDASNFYCGQSSRCASHSECLSCQRKEAAAAIYRQQWRASGVYTTREGVAGLLGQRPAPWRGRVRRLRTPNNIMGNIPVPSSVIVAGSGTLLSVAPAN